MIRSYREHSADILNRIIAHLHQAPLDAIAFWDLQRSARVMCIVHHRDELRPLYFFKRLVTRDDPFHK